MVGPHEVLVYQKWSKTNQLGDKYLLTPLVAIPGSPLCPKRQSQLNMFHLILALPHHPAFLGICLTWWATIPRFFGPQFQTWQSLLRIIFGGSLGSTLWHMAIGVLMPIYVI